MVWACDDKRGTLRRKGGDGNESRAYSGEGRAEDLIEDGWKK